MRRMILVGTAGLTAVWGLAGCGDDSTTDPGLTVVVTPAAATVQVGQARQFTATVTGMTDGTVTWDVVEGEAAGRIDEDGLYTAPRTVPDPPVATVRAATRTDPSRFGTTTITIGPGPPGLVWVEPGTFLMGSSASEEGNQRDELQHWVTLTRGFWLGDAEVTQAEWRAVMGANPSTHAGDEYPVHHVTWSAVVAYCNQRSDREGLRRAYVVDGAAVTWNRDADGYRLPTEAEWEYACRAGTGTRFWPGDSDAELNRAGWFEGGVHGVRHKDPNPWGLYDVHGNVWEWCWDWHAAYASGDRANPVVDPEGPAGGRRRVIRGGAADYRPSDLRSASRGSYDPEAAWSSLGFRVARNPGP